MNSFFERHLETISDATHLAMREALYGMLCKKDIGDEVIHSSDFRKAVVELGLPLGHSIVEDVLVYCKIDSDKGTMDFTELAKELERRRARFNIEQMHKRKNEKKPIDSSSVGSLISKSEHWRAQKEHEKRQEVARYNLKLGKYRPEINAIFTKYANHEMAPVEVVQALQDEVGITPNRHFELLIEDHRAKDDLTFRQFLNGLYKYDPDEKIKDIRSRAAGASTAATGLHHLEQTAENLTQKPIKRTNLEARRAMQARSDKDGAKTFSGKKEAILNDVNPYRDKGLYTDSEQVKKALLRENTDKEMMMTHNQQQMYAGAKGEELDIQFNVEMKLLREQVLAGLRKLDAGDFTISDFQSKIYDLGLHMEPIILKNLKDQLVAGRLNWRNIIHLFDATIFRKKAIYDKPEKSEVERVREKFLTLLYDIYGHGAFVDLISLFHIVDEDNSQNLSFFEFKKACTEHQLMVSEEDPDYGLTEDELRMLFHALDLDGNGTLNIYEFVRGLRGDMSAMRKALVRSAYTRLDTLNSNLIDVALIEKQMQPQYHPDVLTRYKTEDEVVDAMLEFFELTAAAINDDPSAPIDNVSFEQFLEYWTNVSSEIDKDEEFKDIIVKCMQIGEKKPPPALATISKTAELKGAQIANESVQIHGDIVTWQQEESEMELKNQTKRLRKMTRRNAGQRNNYTDYRYYNQLNIFAKEKPEDIESTVKNTKAREVMISSNDTSALTLWDTSKKGIKAQKEEADKTLEESLGSMHVSSSRIASKEIKLAASKDEFGEILIPAGAPSGLFTVADADSLSHTKKRNDGIIHRNYGGGAPWLTPEEDALANQRHKTKNDAKPLRQYAPGRIGGANTAADERDSHGTSLKSMLTKKAEMLPPPPPQNRVEQVMESKVEPSPRKKKVSLMDMAESQVSGAEPKGGTLAELYGM